MKQNEVELDDNQIGFLSDYQESQNFLSIDYIEKMYLLDNSDEIYVRNGVQYPYV